MPKRERTLPCSNVHLHKAWLAFGEGHATPPEGEEDIEGELCDKYSLWLPPPHSWLHAYCLVRQRDSMRRRITTLNAAGEPVVTVAYQNASTETPDLSEFVIPDSAGKTKG